MSRDKISQMLQLALKENSLQLPESANDLLVTYIELVQEWGGRINVTGHKEISDIIYKDIIDNLTTITYVIVVRLSRQRVLDLGCGAGYFGVLFKIVCPDAQLGFLDSNRKKINFCRHACRTLNLTGVDFYQHRLTQFDDPKKLGIEPYDLIATRATWNHETYLQYAHNYVRNCGQIVHMLGREEFQKNKSPQTQEGRALETSIHYDYIIHPKNYKRSLLIEKKIRS